MTESEDIQIDRLSSGGYRLRISPGTVYELWVDLTDAQAREMARQIYVLETHGSQEQPQNAYESYQDFKRRVDRGRVIDMDKISDALRRQAEEQPQPTGNGRIVLFDVLAEIHSPLYFTEWLSVELTERAQVGKAKYGTYLRVNNGRDALRDALDEVLDGLMYAWQLYLETGTTEAKDLCGSFYSLIVQCKLLMDERQVG